jgi:hypothetical protein
MVNDGKNQDDINMMISKYHLKTAMKIVERDGEIEVDI